MQPVVAKCSQIVVNIEGKPCIRGNPGTPRTEGSRSSGVGPDRATADGRLAGDQVAGTVRGRPPGRTQSRSVLRNGRMLTGMEQDLHATVAGHLRRYDQRYTSGRRALVET